MKKLKVVKFTPGLGFGGTEKTVCTFCKYLDRDKFDVSVLSFKSDPASGREQAIRDLGIETGIVEPERLEERLERKYSWNRPGSKG